MPKRQKPGVDEQQFVAGVNVPPAKGKKKAGPRTTAFEAGAKTVGRGLQKKP